MFIYVYQRSRADILQIYGPAEVPKESGSANVDSETSRLLPENGETGPDHGAATIPGV